MSTCILFTIPGKVKSYHDIFRSHSPHYNYSLLEFRAHKHATPTFQFTLPVCVLGDVFHKLLQYRAIERSVPCIVLLAMFYSSYSELSVR